jgi:hypothetical protein
VLLVPFDYPHFLDKHWSTILLIAVQVAWRAIRRAAPKLPTAIDECLQGLTRIAGSWYAFRTKCDALKNRYEISRARRNRLVT